MIDFKILEKLEKSGFKIKRHQNQIGKPMPGAIIEPTPSELIEACGTVQDFTLTRRFVGGENSVSWRAEMIKREKRGTSHFIGLGLSPEEAVANLYLELHV